jgi:hypothetical protein
MRLTLLIKIKNINANKFVCVNIYCMFVVLESYLYDYMHAMSLCFVGKTLTTMLKNLQTKFCTTTKNMGKEDVSAIFSHRDVGPLEIPAT